MKSSLIEKVCNQYHMMGDAAEELGVSRMTIWRWINAEKIQGHTLGREVLIAKSEVERIKREREAK